jgi:hypothetical protein
MDLEMFIAETLRQIVKGIKMAQEHDDCKGAQINPTGKGWDISTKKSFPVDPASRQIEFDVAVTVTEGSEKKGGIGVFTGVLGISGQANSNTANSSVSRIKFSVPVILPTP